MIWLPVGGGMDRVQTLSNARQSGSREARPEPVPPCSFGPYELEAEVGRGGFGVIYRAWHRTLGRRCAVKMIHATAVYPGDDAARALEHEASAAAGLDHPGIVRIHEFGSAEGRVYIALEWVEGTDLGRWLPTRVVPPAEAARLFRGIVEAVAHAHDQGLFHHDLKPANVLVDSTGRVRLTDFGLARRAGPATGRAHGTAGIGTPQYAAPEQASDQFGEPRAVTDVFALGGLLYFLLTDRPPFRGETASGTLKAVLSEDPPPPRALRPGIPEDLEAICLRCLEKRPSRRYASVRDVLVDVDRFLEGEPVLARGEPRRAAVPGWVRRRWRLWAATAVAVVAMAVAGRGWMRSTEALVERERAARAEASAGRERAERETARARRARYAAHVQLAFEAFNQGANESALEALRREVPSDGAPDLRGWEWTFLTRWCTAMPDASVGTGATAPEAAEGVSQPPAPALMSFARLGSGVVAAGLLGDGTRAWVATASGVQAWDATRGTLLHDLPADPEAVESALWLGPDGVQGWVARAWVGGRLGLRALQGDAATVSVEEPGWQVVPRYSGASEMTFSADGTRLVLADVANGVRVHAVPSMELVGRFAGFAARATDVSATGAQVAAADAEGHVRVWARDGNATNAVVAMVPKVQKVSFSGDGSRLLAGTLDGWVRVLDAATGREQGAHGPVGAAILAVAMSPGGGRVAAGTSDGRVIFWDAATGDTLGTLRPGLGAVQAVRFVGAEGLALAATGGVKVYGPRRDGPGAGGGRGE